MSKQNKLYYYIGSSDASGTVSRGSLSLGILTFFLVFGALVLSLSGFGIYFLGQSTYYKYQVSQKNSITQDIISSTASYHTSATELQDSLKRLFKLEDNLRLSYGLPLIQDDVRLLGVGGTPSLLSMATQMLATPSIQNITNLTTSYDQLLRQVSIASITLNDAYEYQEAQDRYYQELPSIWPTGGRVASEYGTRFHPVLGMQKMHDGFDLANPEWTPIKAPADGVVVFQGTRGAYGKMVVLRHLQTDIETRYAHMIASAVEKGQRVQRGAVVGYVGNTGRSTGPHLHYEVRVANQAVNPRRYLPDSLIVME